MFSKLRELMSPTPAASGPPEFIVAGLGNPGKQYENTRHNIGFMALDAIARDLGVRVERLRFKSLTAEATVGGRRVLLMKPSTFMNLSGQAITEAMAFYKIPADKIIVFCDDTALDVGRVRIRQKGSDGGHNGLKNIIYLTGRDDFARVRIGAGKKPHPDYDMADWVLGRFTKQEGEILGKIFANAVDMLTLLVQGRVDDAMAKYNGDIK